MQAAKVDGKLYGNSELRTILPLGCHQGPEFAQLGKHNSS